MPISPDLDRIRAILSNPDAIRRELRRRRVPFGTDAELLDWVAESFGVRIPHTPCCPGHQTPGQAFADAYFARSPVAIWKASRGFGGKSTLLALLALTEAVTCEAEVTILGGSAQQSERILESMRRMWAHPEAPRDLLAGSPALRRTTFVWGNTVTALPASATAVRGPHPQRLRIDEMDEVPLAVVEAAQGQPMDRRGVRAQTVMSSTHQYPDGTMTAMLRRAAELGWSIYTWCWRESLAPHGWLTEAEVERKRSEIASQMWRTEYDLQEPSAEGRAFDPEAVEWTFDLALGSAAATDLDHGWEGEPPAPEGERGADGYRVYYAHGADWAQQRDYTVIATLRCDTRPLRLVAAYRTHRRPWPMMIEALNARMRRYTGPAAHDHTGGGSVVGAYLTAPVVDFTMVGQARRDLFQAYITAVERHEVRSPRIEPFYSEHRYCRVDDLFGGGHPPDTVVACALAYHAFRTQRAPGDYGIS